MFQKRPVSQMKKTKGESQRNSHTETSAERKRSEGLWEGCGREMKMRMGCCHPFIVLRRTRALPFQAPASLCLPDQSDSLPVCHSLIPTSQFHSRAFKKNFNSKPFDQHVLPDVTI